MTEDSKPPMAVIDIATRAADTKRKAVEVPEWVDDDGNPVTIYFRPFTPSDSDMSLEVMRDKYGTDESKWPKMEQRVREIVHKAENEDGSSVFQSGHVHVLMRKVPAAIINRIYVEMVKCAVGFDEAVGKSVANAEEKAG